MTKDELKKLVDKIWAEVEKAAEPLGVHDSRDFYALIKTHAEGAQDGCDAVMDGE